MNRIRMVRLIAQIIVSLVVMAGCGMMEYHILTHVIPVENLELTNRFAGILDALTGAVVYYWIGTSASSSGKDDNRTDIINKQMEKTDALAKEGKPVTADTAVG